MKAIIIAENYIPGGADKMTKLLCEQIGFDEVTLFINHDDDFSVLLNPPMPNNVKIIKYNIPTLYHIGKYVNSFEKHKLIYYILKLLSLVLRYPYIIFLVLYFYIKIKREEPDIVISNNGGYPGGEINRSATISASLFMKKDSVFHIVHNMPTKSIPLFRVFENLYDYMLDKHATIICDSLAIIKQMKQIRNFKSELHLVYLGTEKLKETKEHNKDFTNDVVQFLNIASLDDRKNQLFILEALNILAIKYPSCFRVTFIGAEGEMNYKSLLKNYITVHNLDKYVQFIDFTKELDQYFMTHDVFILASRQEGFPLVNLMAMSSSMPIITTRAGGTDEQVQNSYNGFIVEQNDIQAFTISLENYIKDRNLIKAHGIKSFELFNQHFSFAKMIQNYKKLFKFN